MLTKDDLKLLDEILEDIKNLENEKEVLKKKLKLIVKQLDIMEKAQAESENISKEIMGLEVKEDGRD